MRNDNIVIPRESKDSVLIPVITSADPTGSPVSVTFTVPGTERPTSFATAVWNTSNGVPCAQVDVGPGGAFVLAPGDYIPWWKVGTVIRPASNRLIVT